MIKEEEIRNLCNSSYISSNIAKFASNDDVIIIVMRGYTTAIVYFKVSLKFEEVDSFESAMRMYFY